MGVRCRQTNVVLGDVSLKPGSLIDPRAVYTITFIMVKIFLGVSDSGRCVCGGNITEECPRGTGIEDRSEMRTSGERLD